MMKFTSFFFFLMTNLLASEPPCVLVAGGAGFIGSHLCHALIEKGNRVYCLDNFYTGKKANIEDLLSSDHFHLIEHDIIDPISCAVKFDKIFNLACPASPVHYQNRPLFTIKTSVMGTMNLLEIAKRDRAVFFQASTSEVYGDPLEHPQTEEYCGNVNPIGPRACYDEGKRLAETICFEYHRQFGVPIKVGRIFNTYGPNMAMSDGRVVSNFITQALKNIPITIYGDGSQTRSFCYVDDLVDAIIRFSESKEQTTGPINLGNPDEYTIYELADIVVTMTDTNKPITHKNLPKDDPKVRKPNITKARILLNWKPKIQLKQGLSKTINYFKKEIKE